MVWPTSIYAYGALYGHANVSLPSYIDGGYTKESVIRDLIKFKSDYAIHSGEVAIGPASNQLKEIAAICNEALLSLLKSPN